ncbi:MAG: hypothetical protein IH969_04155 [Candidatus Krumholzibacteriota bacterium]|nr:hypothetical protein [Candidatus Krumholzibacteriota bacterium]
MVQKTVKLLLIKIVPIFLGTMALWQFGGVSKLYHACLVIPLNALTSVLDPSGLIQGATSNGDQILFQILYQGKRVWLDMTAKDITSNSALLWTLFLASPIRPLSKLYFTSFASALLILFGLHVVTVAAAVQHGLLTSTRIITPLQDRPVLSSFLVNYRNFYIEYGMYLFVIALWCPYIIAYLSREGRAGHMGTESKSTGIRPI